MKKTALAKVLSKIGTTAAKKAAGSASQFGYHQAKEPTNLKKISKQSLLKTLSLSDGDNF